LTLNTVADKARVELQYVRDLVRHGHVTPAIPGRKGKGGSAYLTAQQAMGIAIVGATLAVTGNPPPAFVRDTVATIGNIPDQRFWEWVDGWAADQQSPWVEERWAYADNTHSPEPVTRVQLQLGREFIARIEAMLEYLASLRSQPVERLVGGRRALVK
jgi:hypothetical protein